MGSVKTSTRRYPMLAISEATDSEPGAWAVMTTTLTGKDGQQQPVYAYTHRRGGEVRP